MADAIALRVEPIWERQPGETARAYAAFCRYRAMAPQDRSLRRLAQDIVETSTKPRRVAGVFRTLADWSSRYRWVERVAAWDDACEQEARAADLAARQAMHERHLQTLTLAQARLLERLQTFDLTELAPAEALRLTYEAIRLERMLRGEPERLDATSPVRIIFEVVNPDGGHAGRDPDDPTEPA